MSRVRRFYDTEEGGSQIALVHNDRLYARFHFFRDSVYLDMDTMFAAPPLINLLRRAKNTVLDANRQNASRLGNQYSYIIEESMGKDKDEDGDDNENRFFCEDGCKEITFQLLQNKAFMRRPTLSNRIVRIIKNIAEMRRWPYGRRTYEEIIF